MMDALEAILTRRSIREYRDRAVSDEDVVDLIKAAMAAPSAGNEQPWHFVVVDDRELLERIPSVHPYSLMVKKAQLAIVVCGDTKAEKHAGFWVQDCSAAAQNILIAANAKGLGAVWLGVYPREERVIGLQRMLKLPEHVIPMCVIPVGYPQSRLPAPDRFKEERLHRNTW